MSHGQPPHVLAIVPCGCGSHEPYWHGPETGSRVYCCDACWLRRLKAIHARDCESENCRGCALCYQRTGETVCDRRCEHATEDDFSARELARADQDGDRVDTS